MGQNGRPSDAENIRIKDEAHFALLGLRADADIAKKRAYHINRGAEVG